MMIYPQKSSLKSTRLDGGGTKASCLAQKKKHIQRMLYRLTAADAPDSSHDRSLRNVRRSCMAGRASLTSDRSIAS
eukprot:scaffold214_cov249-Pinguiococcus_pyrenoidosus.AAC.13